MDIVTYVLAKNYTDNKSKKDKDNELDYITIKSSTPNSVKKFKITVDDTGTIKATEIVKEEAKPANV